MKSSVNVMVILMQLSMMVAVMTMMMNIDEDYNYYGTDGCSGKNPRRWLRE